MKTDEEIAAAMLAIARDCHERGITFIASAQFEDKAPNVYSGDPMNAAGLCSMLQHRILKEIVERGNHD